MHIEQRMKIDVPLTCPPGASLVLLRVVRAADSSGAGALAWLKIDLIVLTCCGGLVDWRFARQSSAGQNASG